VEMITHADEDFPCRDFIGDSAVKAEILQTAEKDSSEDTKLFPQVQGGGTGRQLDPPTIMGCESHMKGPHGFEKLVKSIFQSLQVVDFLDGQMKPVVGNECLFRTFRHCLRHPKTFNGSGG
jgi:hypothetical protein